MAWQKATGYGRRSLGETVMSRYKALIGRGLRARTLPAQKTEAGVGCAALNRMTRLGMPVAATGFTAGIRQMVRGASPDSAPRRPAHVYNPISAPTPTQCTPSQSAP